MSLAASEFKSKGGGQECPPHASDPEKRRTMPDKFVEIASAARTPVVDAAALNQALRRHLRGDVRFDSSSRALYATDGSNYRQVPIGVVLPRDAEDVERTIAACRKYGAPVLSRGG